MTDELHPWRIAGDHRVYEETTMHRERVLKVALVVVGLIFSAGLSHDDVCQARACPGDDA
jgi:hypothetical protein